VKSKRGFQKSPLDFGPTRTLSEDFAESTAQLILLRAKFFWLHVADPADSKHSYALGKRRHFHKLRSMESESTQKHF
jgi:hypothetical protein